MGAIFLSFGWYIFCKFYKILDPFQKVTIVLYSVAFILKTMLWIFSWLSALYNSFKQENDKSLIPFQSIFGFFISAISFIIFHVIIFRVYTEYDLLKIMDDQEKRARATKLARVLYAYILIYIGLVIADTVVEI